MYRGRVLYGDREIFNNNRLAAYRAILVRTLNMRDCETCDSFEDTYDLPSTDPAPWYSTSHAASADFVGLLPLDISGLDDDVREASTQQKYGNGGFVAPVRRPTREVRMTCLVIGNSEAGRAYGLDWLSGTLNAGARGPVIGADAAFTAPDFIDINAQCGDDRRDLTFYVACPTTDLPEEQAERTLRLAACHIGPTVMDEHESKAVFWYKVEFGFTSNDPFLYGMESAPLSPDISSGSMPTYTCTAPAPLATISDPACPPIPAAPRPPVIPLCYTDDARSSRVAWYIDGADLDKTKATYPILNLDAASAVANLWWRVWPLAEGESDAGALNACGTVGNMIVGYTAAGRSLRVDAAARRATTTIEVSGQTLQVDTTHLLYPPESVPAVEGDPFRPLAMEWPVLYGGGPGYIVYLEGAGTISATLTLVERR